MTASSLLAFAVAMLLPFLTIGRWVGFVSPDWGVTGALAALVVCPASAEFMKRLVVRAPARSGPRRP